jgi:hypothetical protein
MVEALALALQPPAPSHPDAEPQTVAYICGYMRNGRSNPDPRARTDLRLTRRTVQSGSEWTISRLGQPDIAAAGFPARFGIHGSEGMRWQENGAEKRAFITYAEDALADGSRVLWFSLNRPSLWETPGYICQSETPQAGVER